MSFMAEHLGELQNALTEAIEYRERGNSHCPGCSPEAMCGDHAGDQEAANGYRVLRERIMELLAPEKEIEAA